MTEPNGTLRTMEVETWYGKEEIDVQRIKKFYTDLISDRIHSGTCSCPSCLYQMHKEQGGKYDKEIFFLNWLEWEVRFSLVNQTEKIIFETAFDKGNYRTFIEGLDYKKFVKGYGRIKALSNFIKKNFPEIDHNHKRLKLRLWRFQKSGIEEKILIEKKKRWFKAHPAKEMKIWKQNWDDLKFAQRTANFINSRRGKKITQRELLRHFSNKKKENLERIRDRLKSSWQIEAKPIKRSIVYYQLKK